MPAVNWSLKIQLSHWMQSICLTTWKLSCRSGFPQCLHMQGEAHSRNNNYKHIRKMFQTALSVMECCIRFSTIWTKKIIVVCDEKRHNAVSWSISHRTSKELFKILWQTFNSGISCIRWIFVESQKCRRHGAMVIVFAISWNDYLLQDYLLLSKATQPHNF